MNCCADLFADPAFLGDSPDEYLDFFKIDNQYQNNNKGKYILNHMKPIFQKIKELKPDNDGG